jgi:hypothetical protein
MRSSSHSVLRSSNSTTRFDHLPPRREAVVTAIVQAREHTARDAVFVVARSIAGEFRLDVGIILGRNARPLEEQYDVLLAAIEKRDRVDQQLKKVGGIVIGFVNRAWSNSRVVAWYVCHSR